VIPVYRTSRWGPTFSIFTLRRYRTCVKNREDVQMKLAELGLGERLKVRQRRSVARDSPVRVALAAENSVAAATAPRGRRALSGRTTGMRKILRGGWLGAVPRGGRRTVTRTRLPPPSRRRAAPGALGVLGHRRRDLVGAEHADAEGVVPHVARLRVVGRVVAGRVALAAAQDRGVREVDAQALIVHGAAVQRRGLVAVHPPAVVRVGLPGRGRVGRGARHRRPDRAARLTARGRGRSPRLSRCSPSLR
jgi:hypothetical protein